MADPPVPISQVPDIEFLWNWLQSLTVSAAPGGSQFAVQYAATATTFGGVGPLTNGQLVIGSTGVAPVAASLTAGTGISITPGAGSITITNTVSGSSGANPTATVSGSAVNGVAATFMRSDAAPALANTAVTPGSYTAASITVDQQGRLTAASSSTAFVNNLITLTPRAFATLPAAGTFGRIAAVNDSTTAVWGAPVLGGGANNVIALDDGTNWTVMGS